MKTIIVCALLCIGMSFVQCRYLAMTYTDNIKLLNNSDYKMNVFVNYGKKDIDFFDSELNIYVDPNSTGYILQVNKSWDSVFVKHEGVTLIFTEWISSPLVDNEKHGSQKVYGYLYLTKTKLDSLGGEIVFPDEVNLTE